MVHFVAFFKPAQDGNGIFDGGLIDEDGLKAALQGGVFLDVFAILVERGCADQVQFPPGQQRFQQIGCVHGAFGGARAHDRM